MPVAPTTPLNLSVPIAPSSMASANSSGYLGGTNTDTGTGASPSLMFGDRNYGTSAGDTALTPWIKDAIIAVGTAIAARYLWEAMN